LAEFATASKQNTSAIILLIIVKWRLMVSLLFCDGRFFVTGRKSESLCFSMSHTAIKMARCSVLSRRSIAPADEETCDISTIAYFDLNTSQNKINALFSPRLAKIRAPVAPVVADASRAQFELFIADDILTYLAPVSIYEMFLNIYYWKAGKSTVSQLLYSNYLTCPDKEWD
jgi:hypothetical protein